ncbi:RAMP superfamily CRISPR-associated protein [Granulicoccus sp. GXG6511]|uniref:RAMP superfamily CRISPR-associated protein n=1 Tax=Granulicoccus sp. GXG6511 TaxID=3381351 RepID=UPI003D7E8633
MIRYRLQATITLATALHIGGLDDRAVVGAQDTDPDCQVVSQTRSAGGGLPLIPGSSIAGAIAAFLKARDAESLGVATNCWDTEVWGSVDRASAIQVDDVVLPAQAITTIQGNGINRTTGTAAPGSLFRHEVVEAGTRCTLTFTATASAAWASRVHDQIGQIARALRDPRFTLGARSNIGWGRIDSTLTTLQVSRWDTANLAALGHYVEHRFDWPAGQRRPKDPSTDAWWTDVGKPPPRPWVTGPPRIRFTVAWRPITGLLVADEADGNLVASRKAGTQHVLPGTAIRGALRSRASRIARTILAARGRALPDWTGSTLVDQVATDPPLVRLIFGSTQHRGRLTVSDARAQGGKTREQHHNSIDRWSGATTEGHLWRTAPAVDRQWEPLVLDLDASGLDDTRQRAVLALLGLTLSELANGTLRLGGHGNRGLGQVRVIDVALDSPVGTFRVVSPGQDAHEQMSRQILAQLARLCHPAESAPGRSWADVLDQEHTT